MQAHFYYTWVKNQIVFDQQVPIKILYHFILYIHFHPSLLFTCMHTKCINNHDKEEYTNSNYMYADTVRDCDIIFNVKMHADKFDYPYDSAQQYVTYSII